MRVLIVEDEKLMAAAVARGLEADGFLTDVAHDGLDGLWRAREFEYDAIVLDILLPGIDGYRLCRTLRDEGIDTPVLMLTAKIGDHDEADALDIGADDFLRKPFSYVVLVARLRALGRRSRDRAPRIVQVGRVSYDLNRRRATADANEIHLTGRETAMLDALARRRGDVVAKTELLDLVWGADFHGDPNVVEVYIGYLRRKLGADTIRTIRGAGYQLGAS